ncbi:bacterial extracellular solute-binding s, 5 Middle family protein, partial [Chlamydia psittaci 02DC14]
KDWNTMFS